MIKNYPKFILSAGQLKLYYHIFNHLLKLLNLIGAGLSSPTISIGGIATASPVVLYQIGHLKYSFGRSIDANGN